MVVKLIVKDVVQSREISLTFVDTNDLGIQLSVEDLRDQCAEHWDDEDWTDRGLFIFEHNILHSKQDQITVGKASTAVMYFLSTSFPLPQENKVHFELDEISMKAAAGWLAVDADPASNPVTSQLVLAMQKPEGYSSVHDIQAENVAPPVQAAVPVAAPVNWLELLQLGKLVQLGFFFFVFTYNRPYSDEKKIFIGIVMFLVYLLQVGLFKWLFKRIYGHFNNRRGNNEAVNQQGVGAANANNAANQAVPARDGNNGFNRVLNMMQSLSQHGVRIPRTVGIIYDLYSFVLGFVGSVFPGWQPLAAVVAPAQPV